MSTVCTLTLTLEMSTGQGEVTVVCGWKSNCRPGVALATCVVYLRSLNGLYGKQMSSPPTHGYTIARSMTHYYWYPLLAVSPACSAYDAAYCVVSLSLSLSLCVCVCMCVLGTRVSCAKTGEPIELPTRGLTTMGPRNHVGIY